MNEAHTTSEQSEHVINQGLTAYLVNFVFMHQLGARSGRGELGGRSLDKVDFVDLV